VNDLVVDIDRDGGMKRKMKHRVRERKLVVSWGRCGRERACEVM
jgi:hypothetical protein